jgi:hypothetical protein
MGIFPNHLIDCVLKKPIKEIHLVVNNGVYITWCYPIKKEICLFLVFPICDIKRYTGVSYRVFIY